MKKEKTNNFIEKIKQLGFLSIGENFNKTSFDEYPKKCKDDNYQKYEDFNTEIRTIIDEFSDEIVNYLQLENTLGWSIVNFDKFLELSSKVNNDPNSLFPANSVICVTLFIKHGYCIPPDHCQNCITNAKTDGLSWNRIYEHLKMISSSKNEIWKTTFSRDLYKKIFKKLCLIDESGLKYNIYCDHASLLTFDGKNNSDHIEITLRFRKIF